MNRLYYSTGQVAQQLGVALATVRTLCANGVIAAETSPGGHLRIPAAEVERLLREGVPPIPRPLPSENAPTSSRTTGGHTHPEFSDNPPYEVALEADEVAITRSTLEKRKIEREIEEHEDWFRERQYRQAAAEAAERQKAEAKQTEQRRLKWIQDWTQYAINSLPYNAREAEIEVHAAVQELLCGLDPRQPQAITQRLVDAAVHKALAPWTRKQEIERALQASMNALGSDIQYRAEYAALKHSAWDAAVAAVGRVRAEASYREMETAVVQAVKPMIREYKHQRACQHIVENVYVFDATREEREAATEAVRKAVAALPIGADPKQFDTAQRVALAPYKAAVAARKERARLESEEQAQRRATSSKADSYLGHIAKYLEKEYTFDGGAWERLRETNRLQPLIREALIEELLEDPEMSAEEIRESIEEQIDDALDE